MMLTLPKDPLDLLHSTGGHGRGGGGDDDKKGSRRDGNKAGDTDSSGVSASTSDGSTFYGRGGKHGSFTTPSTSIAGLETWYGC